ncbi:MAG: hypothetical protein AABY22_23335 [Nanoarchaeota archaeon]
MKKKEMYGWLSNILNLIIFTYIIINTTGQCFNQFQMGLTAFGIIVSIIVQTYSTLREEDEL